MCNIPRIASIHKAVDIYNNKPLLFNKDIMELFDCGVSKAITLKKLARDRMKEEEKPIYNAYAVDTDVAYKTWGLDIDDLEKRVMKIKKVRGK